ncbi:ornithine cyclodeaminase family protein [Ruegeria sp. 6PALISEP08]|uniref:ornithine cyclodeaminase family protein n=1 Tax=Ruegeria sp. 6PALISEP08 TaxID=1225660 RepID=UPI00067F2892|nr:ornithine cyclodeaminase family protein [Ruegeria sp. 6PALISEP08]
MADMNIPYLSQDDMIGLGLTTEQIVDSIECAIRGSVNGTVWGAPKAVITPLDDPRYMMAALAAMDDPSLLAVKTVVLNPENNANGLPQINGLVTMLDSVTGLPAAVLDGNWITEVRTAGLSAMAAKYMANSDAKTIGFVGCGAQARSHLDAFADIFDLEHMCYFGRGQANQDRLAEQAKARGIPSTACASGQEVAASCDLLVTTVTHTGGAAPFLDASGMKAGSFAAVVDLAAPWKRDSLGTLDCVVIDDLKQEASLPNKLCDPGFIHGDLAGLVTGETNGRNAREDRTAFIFRGHALGDLALSVLVLETHRKRDAGRLTM